jgi:hypothetical protein
MNSTVKGLLYLFLGVLSLAWFGYGAFSYFSHRGPSEDNPVVELFLMGLKLVMAVTFFVSGINALLKKK